MEKKFTEKDIEEIVKITIIASVNGFRDFIKNDMIIVDKTTREQIPNSILDIIKEPKKLMETYIYTRLEQNGIIIKPNPEIED